MQVPMPVQIATVLPKMLAHTSVLWIQLSPAGASQIESGKQWGKTTGPKPLTLTKL